MYVCVIHRNRESTLNMVISRLSGIADQCNLKSQVTKPVLVYCKLNMWESIYLFNLTPCATHPLSMFNRYTRSACIM